MLNIKSGETINYSDLAKKIGKEKAVRAVGTVCAKNKLALIVPCHRVLPKNGSIGNYRFGGKKIKTCLLYTSDAADES